MASVSAQSRPYVIVLGNEKGGSGKSTTSIHIIVSLLRDGYSVGAMDLDARQGTLAGTLAARKHFVESKGIVLPLPAFHSVHRSILDNRLEAEAEERLRFDTALAEFEGMDVVVIDCPGADTYLSRYGHSHADTLITPINDSFVDFSMLAKVDPDNHDIVNPSIYSEMVWEARKNRFSRDRGKIDWMVMRNRLAASEARNKRDVGETLDLLAKRIGFRTLKGFGERVIFRELYLQGLTLMDVREANIGIALGLSHIAARNEVRSLISAIKLPPSKMSLVA
ncbi:division plane positioning ATPase MipZ [Acidocella sp.]|uniref:division plane positioning ATPase MipZ n=1 Tax=Acidocella sp. TaxID=50710 RepID=UPI0026254F5D|nr:division plane positioning ATPase MipZ [Acidocella sp.]MDD2794768.1 division plane positioning ATPase MipZ [Acidocella sp.]